MLWNVIAIILLYFSNLLIIAPAALILVNIVPIPNFEPWVTMWVQKILQYAQIEYNLFSALALVSAVIMLGCGTLGVVLGWCPFTRWFIRYLNEAQKPTAEEQQKLDAALDYLQHKSGKNLKGQYKMFVSPNAAQNAFAFNTNDICVTRALLMEFEIPALAGIIAHEIGHHKHGDTLEELFLMSVLFFACACILIDKGIACFFRILSCIPYVGFVFTLLSWGFNLLFLVQQLIADIPCRFIELVCERQQEYDADSYAVKLGVGNELVQGLEKLQQSYGDVSWRKSFFLLIPDLKYAYNILKTH